MKIKKCLLALAMIMLGLGVLAPSVAAVSCPSGSINSSADSLAECNIEKDDSLWPTVQVALNVILGLVAIISVIMIIIGGIHYTVSQGDATKVKKAKDTIIYSVIGLVIALLSFAIVNFVLSQVFNDKKSVMEETKQDKKTKTSYIESIETVNRIA